MQHIKLYECADEVAAALNELQDIDEQWAVDTIEAVVGQFEVKGVSVAAYYLNQEATLNQIDAHIKAMQSRKNTMQNQQNKLKEYLARNMQRVGLREIAANDGTFKAKFVKNPPSVDVFDEKQLPEEMMRVTTIIEPDKTAIKEALKAGINVAGARLVSDKETLRIK